MIDLPDLYPEDSPLDQTAYCLLLRIHDLDNPVWKRQAYRKLNQWRENDQCPLNRRENVSLQTVCRRIDMLVEQGHLKPRTHYAPSLGQYVEAYRVTENGRKMLKHVTDQILDNMVIEYLRKGIRAEALVLKEGTVQKLIANDLCDDIDSFESIQDRAEQVLDDLPPPQTRTA